MKINKRQLCITVGQKLRGLREEFNLTVPEMSERLRLKANTYRKNESGVAFPSPNTLHHLVKEFAISLDWFFFNHGPQYFKQKDREEELEGKIKELQSQLEEAENTTAAGSGLPSEVKELVDHMAKTPLLHYEILAQYHRFKMNHKGETTNL